MIGCTLELVWELGKLNEISWTCLLSRYKTLILSKFYVKCRGVRITSEEAEGKAFLVFYSLIQSQCKEILPSNSRLRVYLQPKARANRTLEHHLSRNRHSRSKLYKFANTTTT